MSDLDLSQAASSASDDLQWTEDEKDQLRQLEPKPLVFNMIKSYLDRPC